MQELIIILIGLLLFVSAIIILLVRALSRDTLKYDMEYLWNDYDVQVEDLKLEGKRGLSREKNRQDACAESVGKND